MRLPVMLCPRHALPFHVSFTQHSIGHQSSKKLRGQLMRFQSSGIAAILSSTGPASLGRFVDRSVRARYSYNQYLTFRKLSPCSWLRFALLPA
jgi:hypothetical protein